MKAAAKTGVIFLEVFRFLYRFVFAATVERTATRCRATSSCVRRLQGEHGASSHVFMTERDGPMTPKAFHACSAGSESGRKCRSQSTLILMRHGCGYAVANVGHDTKALQAWLGHRNIHYTMRYTRRWRQIVQELLAIGLTWCPGAAAPRTPRQNDSGPPKDLRALPGGHP